MRIKLLNIILFLYCCTLAPGCNHTHQIKGLQAGDILFQNFNCSEIVDAIKAVTTRVDGKDFSQCALVINNNDIFKVIEHIGDKIPINSLKNLFTRSADILKINNILVERVKHQFENLILNAISKARQLIGQPYDNEFFLNNVKLYCSEFILEVLKPAIGKKDFFELAPMTFKDPEMQSFFPAWITFYKELNTEIPGGQKGINPKIISHIKQ